MQLFNKYRKAILIAIVAIIVVIISVTIYRRTTLLEVVASTPASGSTVSYETPIITIDFSKDISDKDLVVESPDGLIISKSIEGKRLNINIFSGLVVNREYNFTLKSVVANDGSKLTDFSIKFFTTATTKLSDAERDLILERQQRNKPSLISDPILEYLPHHTDEYNIKPYLDSSSDGKGAVTIEITSYLTRDDVNKGSDAATTRIQQAAETYLKSLKNITLSNYIIIYKVQLP